MSDTDTDTDDAARREYAGLLLCLGELIGEPRLVAEGHARMAGQTPAWALGVLFSALDAIVSNLCDHSRGEAADAIHNRMHVLAAHFAVEHLDDELAALLDEHGDP